MITDLTNLVRKLRIIRRNKAAFPITTQVPLEMQGDSVFIIRRILAAMERAALFPRTILNLQIKFVKFVITVPAPAITMIWLVSMDVWMRYRQWFCAQNCRILRNGMQSAANMRGCTMNC